MANVLNLQAIVLLAIRLVQPGRLADVADGVARVLPSKTDPETIKDSIGIELEALRLGGLVKLDTGRRYVLSPDGEAFVSDTGLGFKIDSRRMFLLKETRKRSKEVRGGTRD